MTVGRLLRSSRTSRMWAACDIAETIGVSAAHVCDWEHDRRGIPVHRLETVARVYEVDLLELTRLSVRLPDGFMIVRAESLH